MHILIVDDHPTISAGLKIALLEFGKDNIASIATKTNPVDALNYIKNNPIDVLITDYVLSNTDNGLELSVRIREILPKVRVVLHTFKEDVDLLKDAIALNVNGYILKSYDASYVCSAVFSTTDYFSPELTKLLVAYNEAHEDEDKPIDSLKLLHLEREIMIQTAQLMLPKDIASNLGIQLSTFYSYKKKLMRKLEVDSDVGIAHFAYKYGFVNLND